MTAEEQDEVEASFLTFGQTVLKHDLYDWQAEAVIPFDDASTRMVRVSLCTPNESGKSAVVIPTVVLGWLATYPQGRVVITTADGKQLDNQVMPALERYRNTFAGWVWTERSIRTPTGGFMVAFTTDDPGRAEGWHKLNNETGPLLIVVDEGKTVADGIYDSIDRCGYNALLLTSSPGPMHGRFYDSQTRRELGYIRIKVGLLDCPHIGQEKIDRIVAQHGPDAPFTRSALHGEFMLAEGETKFDRDGLKHLMVMAEGHDRAGLGVIEPNCATQTPTWMSDAAGWLWMDEKPMGGCDYLIFCDPNTCEQAVGTSERDNTAAGVIRAAYIDEQGVEWKDQLVAALHWPGGVKWDADVLATRIDLLSKYYGRCMAVVEANNFGSALMVHLQRLGVPLWQRTKVDDVNPNKTHRVNGFLSTERTRTHWVEAGTAMVREQSMIMRYHPACQEYQTFIVLPSGRAEAQEGCHDDWVAGIGIGLVVRCFTRLPKRVQIVQNQRKRVPVTTSASPFGACG